MTEYWQDLNLEGREAAAGIVAKVRFTSDSLWFSGHFPGHPIVPGVALLHVVAEALRRAEGSGWRTVVTSIRRVRFRQPVRPDEEVTVQVFPEGQGRDGSYQFRLLSGEETVCTGAVRTARALPGGSAR
jgi:3-hydroxymyristoyl/3-hydroxydecanoyl-(acyl carrier protein) dehydratase